MIVKDTSRVNGNGHHGARTVQPLAPIRKRPFPNRMGSLIRLRFCGSACPFGELNALLLSSKRRTIRGSESAPGGFKSNVAATVYINALSLLNLNPMMNAHWPRPEQRAERTREPLLWHSMSSTTRDDEFMPDPTVWHQRL